MLRSGLVALRSILNEVVAQLLDDVGNFLRSGGFSVDGDDDTSVGLHAVDSLLALLGTQDAIGSRQKDELGLTQNDSVSLEMGHFGVVCCESGGLGSCEIEVGALGPDGSVQSDDGGALNQAGANQLIVDVILPAHFT